MEQTNIDFWLCGLQRKSSHGPLIGWLYLPINKEIYNLKLRYLAYFHEVNCNLCSKELHEKSG